jgi:hypothetical protein
VVAVCVNSSNIEMYLMWWQFVLTVVILKCTGCGGIYVNSRNIEMYWLWRHLVLTEVILKYTGYGGRLC